MAQLITASKRLRGMLESGAYSDFTITCGTASFRVHRCVLAQHEGPFAAACSGQFKEGVEGVLDCPDDKADAMKALIQFFYSNDYLVEDSTAALEHHLNIYVIAHKYMEPYLQRLAKKRYLSTIDAITEITDSSLVRAARLIWRDDALKQDKELREATVGAIKKHSKELFEGNDTLGEENRQIFSLVSLQVDLATASGTERPVLMECPDCGEKSRVQPRNPQESYTCPDCYDISDECSWRLVFGD